MSDDETATESGDEYSLDEVKLILEQTSSFHDTGIFFPSRTIFLGSEIANMEGETGCDAKMAERFLKNLHVLETLSDNPITVMMNNIGGDEYHGSAIYDAIKLSPCEITIKVRGHAMSMGSIILQAADRRVMAPTSMQMIHYGTWGVHTHSKTFQRIAEEGKRIDDWMEQMYLTRIHKKRPEYQIEELRRLLDHDSFLTAEQSIALGLADEVG